MRRGLIAWSKAELPAAVFERRIARMQQAMAAAGLDALVLYTNNTRTAGVSWFVGFIPYWSEGLLVIPRRGNPSLVVGLSKRVQFWLERTSHVPVYNAPRVGSEAGRIIAETAPTATVGVADLDDLPTGAAADMTAAADGLRLVDATVLVQRSRAAAEPTEIALSMAAADIAHRALSLASTDSSEIGTVLATAEREARRLGAEEVYLAAACDLERSPHLRRIEGEAPLGRSFAVRATVAYKGHWVRMVRTLRRNDANPITEARQRFAEAVALLPDTKGLAGASSWLVEGCRISQPLEPLAGSAIEEPVALSPGALVSVNASYTISGAPILVGSPALIGHGGDASALLLQRDFEHV